MSRRWRTMLPVALGMAMVLPAMPAVPGPVRAAPDWPPSADVLVGEVVTGGATGSDEYVELYNGGDLAVQLDGLELVYVTATGGTVTTKHRWTDRRLAPRGHLLLANADGVFAAVADHTYTNGLSATGGSLVLRAVGGGVIDSLSWGTAASSFVEGSPGVAPPAGSSLARLPGGADGNRRDTNDNAADTFIDAMPIPEGSAPDVDPTPEPTPSTDPRPDRGADPRPDRRADGRAHPRPDRRAHGRAHPGPDPRPDRRADR